MGLGLIVNGKEQVITPRKGAWASVVNMPTKPIDNKSLENISETIFWSIQDDYAKKLSKGK